MSSLLQLFSARFSWAFTNSLEKRDQCTQNIDSLIFIYNYQYIAVYNGWSLFNPAVFCNRGISVLYMKQCVPTFVLCKLFTDFNLQLLCQILMDATCLCKLLFLDHLSFYVFQTVHTLFYILS